MADFTESLFRGIGQGEQIANRGVRDRSAQLKIQSQELGLRQGQAEQDRFLQDSNLRSIVQGALEFTKLDPQDNQAQIQFLQNRAEQINDRGGDPRDTLELIQQTPQQRQQSIQSVLNIGERAGIIKPQQRQQRQDLTTMARGLIEEGFSPSTPEFKAELTRRRTAKKSPLVTVQTGDKVPQLSRSEEESKLLQKADVAEFIELRKESKSAEKILSRIAIMKNFKIKTGALEPFKAKIAGIADGFGFDKLSRRIGDATGAQAINSLTNDLVNTILNAAKGPQTDQDANRAFAIVSDLGDTEGAFQFKLSLIDALKFQAVRKFRFIDKKRRERVPLEDAFSLWEEEKLKVPMISKRTSAETGLPLFFIDFEKAIRSNPKNKDATRAEIVEAWSENN